MSYVKHFIGEVIAEGYPLLEQTGKDRNGYLLGKFNCPFCNTIFESRIADVKKGHTKSCGCLSIEARSKNGKKNIIDYTGSIFGKLTVLSRSSRKNSCNGNAYWQCQCECGNIIDVSSANIQKQKSCGCLQSKGEFLIANLLTGMGIQFEKQKKFNSCVYNNHQLRFDFFLPNLNILIEYDGIQHFFTQNSGWDTFDKLTETQNRDNFKNNWCKKNNLRLIRIPYTDFDILSQEYLLTKIGDL